MPLRRRSLPATVTTGHSPPESTIRYITDLFRCARLTAAVIGSYAGKVALIDTRTRLAVAQVKVGAYPVAAAIAG
jgi:YVTN family beta-propeller protein